MNHDDLMILAVDVLDAFEDVDDMAPIGVLLDALAISVRESSDMRAVLAVRDRVASDRIVSVLNGDGAHQWKAAWVRKHAGCGHDDAERVAVMPSAVYQKYDSDEHLERSIASLAKAATGLANELRHLLAPYGASPVPDTVPADWVADLGGETP